MVKPKDRAQLTHYHCDKLESAPAHISKSSIGTKAPPMKAWPTVMMLFPRHL